MPKAIPTAASHRGFPTLGEPPRLSQDGPPRGYQEVKAAEIPEVTDDDGTRARIICGNFWGT